MQNNPPLELIARLRLHARTNADKIAYRDAATGDSLTYRSLLARVAAFANHLHRTLPAESVVLIHLENTLDFPVAFLGAIAAGMIAFPVSPDSPPAEVERLAERSSAAVVIDSGSEHDVADLPPIPLADDRTRLMLLSSGSTGSPKIVCRSGRSLDAVSEQMCQSIGFQATDRVLVTVPFCHSYGLEHGLLAPLWAGATVQLCRGFDLPLVERELNRSAITVLPGVPSMFEMLARLGLEKDAMKNLRAAYSAGGPLPPSIAKEFSDRFGVSISQLYGATEIGSITYSDPRLPGFNPVSVGRPMKNVQIAIDDGQVIVRADSMFSGYLDEPAINDGVFPTGDLGHIDDHGNLVITGRTKLLIDIGGRKVNPMEVEEVLRQHERVADCVVVPIHQTETLVRIKAIVTAKDAERPPDFADLRHFARTQLTSYKVPRLFELRDALPRNATGKINRQAVVP